MKYFTHVIAVLAWLDPILTGCYQKEIVSVGTCIDHVLHCM